MVQSAALTLMVIYVDMLEPAAFVFISQAADKQQSTWVKWLDVHLNLRLM